MRRATRTITGTAIVFNRGIPGTRRLGRKIQRDNPAEAVTMAFLNTQDVKMNLLHDRKMTIARGATKVQPILRFR